MYHQGVFMSEYRRFFSYMYAYEEGAKTSNVGFAKIEMRGTQTSIELHMHGCNLQIPTASLCLFVRNDDRLLGFPIGEVPFSGGSTDRRFVLAPTTFSGSTYQINDVAGILLLCQDHICFVSQWDEAPIDWSGFELYMPPAAEPDDVPGTDDESGEPEAQPSDMPSGENVIQSTELPLSQPQPDNIRRMASAAQRSTARSSSRNSWEENWNLLLLSHPVIQPFADEQIQCIRAELKDLRLLPPSNWHLCNNSFLLHSFFMYRHLIIGRFPSGKGMKWFVGVPGIRYRQEHVLAAIFGFSDFLPEKASADADAPFGYWYTIMSAAD